MARTKNHLRRWIVLLLVVVLCGSYVTYVLAQPIPTIDPHTNFTYTASIEIPTLTWPANEPAAIGALGYGVLAQHGSTTPLPTASTIKILTALAVLKEHPLVDGEPGPSITITTTDVASYNKYIAEDGSVVKVTLGQQLSEYQALQDLLLPSANNIAETLARWAFGSISAYNTYAMSLAAQIGMTSTVVTDPSGFLPTTISTPHDLTLLGETALTNPVITDIVSQPSAIDPQQGTIYNVNTLLGHDGIIGIKTGNNDQDKGCFLFAAKHQVGTQTITVVGTIMNASSLNKAMTDSLPLIDSARANFHEQTIVHAGELVASYTAPWTKPINAVTQTTYSAISWDQLPSTARAIMQPLHAPMTSTTSIGSIVIEDGTIGKIPHSVSVHLTQPMPQPSLIWRLTHPPLH